MYAATACAEGGGFTAHRAWGTAAPLIYQITMAAHAAALARLHLRSTALVALPLSFGLGAFLPATARCFGGDFSSKDDEDSHCLQAGGTALIVLVLIGWPILLAWYREPPAPRRQQQPPAASQPPQPPAASQPHQPPHPHHRARRRWRLVEVQPLEEASKRRVAALALGLLGSLALFCHAQAVLGRLPAGPSAATRTGGLLLLAHALPLGCIADVWFSGRGFGGFEPSDAPRGRATRQAAAGGLMLLAALLAAAGSGMAFAGPWPVGSSFGSSFEGAADSEGSSSSGGWGGGGAAQEAGLGQAERCYLVWGVATQPLQVVPLNVERADWVGEGVTATAGDAIAWHSKGQYRSAALLPGFDPLAPAAQVDLARMCDALVTPTSPLHSAYKRTAGAERLPCPFASLREAARTRPPREWPIASADDAAKRLKVMLKGDYEARATVGYTEEATTRGGRPAVQAGRVAWTFVRAHSTELPLSFIGRPAALGAYMERWKGWFASLPALVNSTGAVGSGDAAMGRSVLVDGFASCGSWEIAATQRSFRESILRAILFTPLFCIAAVFWIVRDVVTSYMALYTICGMLVVTMGLLHALGLALGPIESLALALILGVSIDYVIHLAFAYKQSLVRARFYKTRAALLARTTSVVTSGLTTLASVAPLLGSRLAPLRQFGTIFTTATLVALAFATGFFVAFLMAAGPKATRAETLEELLAAQSAERAAGERAAEYARVEAAVPPAAPPMEPRRDCVEPRSSRSSRSSHAGLREAGAGGDGGGGETELMGSRREAHPATTTTNDGWVREPPPSDYYGHTTRDLGAQGSVRRDDAAIQAASTLRADEVSREAAAEAAAEAAKAAAEKAAAAAAAGAIDARGNINNAPPLHRPTPPSSLDRPPTVTPLVLPPLGGPAAAPTASSAGQPAPPPPQLHPLQRLSSRSLGQLAPVQPLRPDDQWQEAGESGNKPPPRRLHAAQAGGARGGTEEGSPTPRGGAAAAPPGRVYRGAADPFAAEPEVPPMSPRARGGGGGAISSPGGAGGAISPRAGGARHDAHDDAEEAPTPRARPSDVSTGEGVGGAEDRAETPRRIRASGHRSPPAV